VKTDGKRPSPRHCHSGCIIKNDLYIIGGTDEVHLIEPQALDDVYRLNLNTMIWSSIKTQGIPPNLVFHSLHQFDDHQILTLWNSSGVMKISFLDIDSLQWKELLIEPPLPKRRLASQSIFYNNKLFLLGGFSETRSPTVILDYFKFAPQQITHNSYDLPD
jgi:N-acetylneuraminic acid mutarotase